MAAMGLIAEPVLTLNGLQMRAAFLLAEGRSHADIARELKKVPQTISKWASRRDFHQQVDEYRKALRESVLNSSLINRDMRVQAYEAQFARINLIINERAKDPKMQRVAGGKSGLLGYEKKFYGKNADVVVEVYEFDAALDNAYRGVLKDIAKEAGDLPDSSHLFQSSNTTTINGNVQINHVEVPALTDHLAYLRQSASRNNPVEGSMVHGATGANSISEAGTGEIKSDLASG